MVIVAMNVLLIIGCLVLSMGRGEWYMGVMLLSPVLNLLLGTLSLIFFTVVWDRSGGMACLVHIVLSIALPLACCVMAWVIPTLG
jgi:hypothetical protein